MRPRPPPTKLGMQTPRQQPRGRHAVRYRTTAASPLSPVGRGLLCNVGSMGGKGWRKMARPRCCVTVTGKHGKQKQTVTSTRSRRQEEGGAEQSRGRGRGRGAQSWLPAGRSPAVVLRHSLGKTIIISPSLSPLHSLASRLRYSSSTSRALRRLAHPFDPLARRKGRSNAKPNIAQAQDTSDVLAG
jgi:hypothetical protein